MHNFKQALYLFIHFQIFLKSQPVVNLIDRFYFTAKLIEQGSTLSGQPKNKEAKLKIADTNKYKHYGGKT